MTIKPYSHADCAALFALMEREGQDRDDYRLHRHEQYLRALSSSSTYLVWEENALYGTVAAGMTTASAYTSATC